MTMDGRDNESNKITRLAFYNHHSSSQVEEHEMDVAETEEEPD